MRRLLVAIAVLASMGVGARGHADSGLDSVGSETLRNTVQYHDGTWIVELRPGTDTKSFLRTHGITEDRANTFRELFTGFSAFLTADQVSVIADDPDTVSVDADEIVTALADQTTGPVSTNITNSGVLPWGLDLIDQRTTTGDGHYLYSTNGSGVRAYVVDTGVNAAHADFGGRVVDGWSYRTSSTHIASITSSLNDPVKAPYGGSCKNVPGYSASNHQTDVDIFDQTVTAGDTGKTDNEGHGTHVAGIIGGSLTGVAKNVTIVPVRILNSCGYSTTSVAAAGLEWIVTDHSNTQPSLVNMSIGFSPSETWNSVFGYRPCRFERWITGAYDPSSATTVCRTQPTSWLLAEGITVVAAAGNSPSVDPCTTAPAATPGAISVGAVTATMNEAVYSAYGECVDIFAPGGSGYVDGGVNSTWHYLSTDASNSSTYSNQSGTSMAAPHVSGVVARYLGGLGSLPGDISTLPGQVWNWLKQQSTCGIVTYANSSRSPQSPNRFVNAGSAPAVPCAPTGITKTQESGRSTIAWSELPSANGSDTTGYQVTTNPATTGCTTDASTFTCALTGLTDGTTYTVSVQGINGVGAGTAGTISLVAGTSGIASTTTTVAPTTTTTVAPTTTTTTIAPTTTTTVVEAPSTTVPAVSSSAANPVTAVSSTKSLLLRWPAVTSAEAVTYVVSVTPGGVSCTTSNTSCTFLGVSVGTVYNFSIVAKTPSGQTSVALRYTVTAGINQKYTSVKKSSRTTLTKIVTSLSKGKRTYKVTSGKCKVSAGRLVAPSATGTCKLKVSIAKYRTYKAMSAVLTIHVV